jgi:peptidoglycan/xylan/chitin deacetylase (PgdA/CDA1 family)
MNYVETYSEACGVRSFGGRARGLARHTALSVLAPFSRPAKTPVLRLLYCHHVFDDERAGFAAALDYLMSIGDFLNTKDVLRVVSGERRLTRHAFHMSFDDGLKNIVTNALPILRERAIPAIMFVATEVTTDPARFPHLQRFQDTAPAFEHATWADLELARAQGFEVGSHTATHARLSEISGSEQRLEDEIAGSKHMLQRMLGTSDYIAWPYGTRADVDDRAIAMIEKAGYEACFGAFRGQIVHAVTDRFRIPRHHFEPHWPLSHIRYFALGAGER